MEPGQAASPLTPTRFTITIDGVEIASFSDLVALTSDVTMAPDFSAPASTNPPTVTLRRGLTDGMELSAWHQAVREGNMSAARKSLTLTMYAGGEAVAKYWMEQAAPIKLDVAPLPDGGSDGLYETVTLGCVQIQRVTPS
jgi:phage tail-like protein